VNKEFELKRIFATFVSFVMVIGLVGYAQAGATAGTSARTTKAPPAVQARTRNAMLSRLKSSKRLGRHQLKALGLKPLSRQQVARINQLYKSNGAAKAATAGTYYWYSYHYYGNIWVNRYYSGPYYSYPWYPYYVVYDNFLVCTASGTGCYDANAYTYSFDLYYYPNSQWYYDGPAGYTLTSQTVGFGPYSG
jgi:hypothetical protein